MKKIYLIIIVAFVLLFSTCTKDKEPSQLKIFIHNVETTDSSASIEGEYVYDNEINDLYLLYGKDSLLIDGTAKKKVDLKGRQFSVIINDLLPNTQHYYCIEYYSKYSNFKTKIYDFVTQETEEPSLPDVPDDPSTPEEPDDSNDISSVTTSDVTDITSNSAICGGIIVSDDMTIITSCGVCWNTYSQPTINDSHTSDEIGNGIFISELTNLEANTKFYVRAYATNEIGTAYGEQKEFSTLINIVAPEVTTNDITAISPNSATCGGNVISDGNAEVIAKGVCWSTSPDPTIYHDHTTDGSGLGSFVSYLSNLNQNTKYYVRAYATNKKETAYGEEKCFETKEIVLPTVITYEVTGVTTKTAICSGNVALDGNATVTARGICWSTNSNPTIDDSYKTIGSGTGSFTADLENLLDNTTYYVRAFATNEKGIAYGEEKWFKTTEIMLPTVITYEVTDIISNTAVCGGNVTSDGNAMVTAKGVCWSTDPNPTIDDNKTTDGYGLGLYSSVLTPLTQNTAYYVRAYAVNEKGVSYGEEKSFTTIKVEGTSNSYDWVDLGLPSGLKWAKYNVGAENPEEYGKYYYWGQIESDNWGGSWRMPTKTDFQELINECAWVWITQNGVLGYEVTGVNGGSIFIPASGYMDDIVKNVGYEGNYWSSTPCDGYYLKDGYYLWIHSDSRRTNSSDKNYRYSKRLVLEE